MASIIKHKKTGEKFILLGSGFGMYQSTAPSALLGNWSPNTNKGSEQAICACKENGEILWLRSTDVTVIKVDGKSPDQYFY